MLLIMAARIDTTSNSTEYGFLLLAKYPDIQEMIYKQLQDVMKLLNELHVLCAFIHEVLRISSVTPTELPHITNKEL